MPYVSGRVFAGQKTGVTTAPGPLDANLVDGNGNPISQGCREVLVQNDLTSRGNLLVGDVNGQFVALTPGQSITIPIISLSRVYVKMAAGTGTANWLARD